MSRLVVTTADGEKIVGSDDVGLKGSVVIVHIACSLCLAFMQAFPVGTQVRPLNMLRGGLGSWMLLACCSDIIALSISCCC